MSENIVSSPAHSVPVGMGFIILLSALMALTSLSIAATSTAAALDQVPENVCAASALIGALQYGSGIVSSGLIALFSDNTAWTMSWIIGLFTLSAALIALLISRNH